jgi:RimJ/RimL family protein N-acetyltransferase
VLGEPDVRVVIARCDNENVPSIRMLERLGFAQTGETNGQIRWRF